LSLCDNIRIRVNQVIKNSIIIRIERGTIVKSDLDRLMKDRGFDAIVIIGRDGYAPVNYPMAYLTKRAKITHGMIAKSGAIEGVYAEENTLRYRVIGNIRPKGICGSGLVDLVAVLLHCRLINHEGLIEKPTVEDENQFHPRVIEREGVNDFLNKIHNQKVNAQYMGRLGVDLPFMLFLNKPITQVSDLKGLKVRCSPTHIEFLKKVGAQPMVIPPPDVHTALERGVVDGFIQPLAGGFTRHGFHEVVKYIVKHYIR